jgi:dsRNA-specific ribonuclease
MRDFPYAECCLAWQDHGIAREVSVSQQPAFSDVLKALTAIGTTLRTGSDSKKKIMLDTIRARCDPPELGPEGDLRNHDPMQERARRSQVDHSEATRQDGYAAAEDQDISRYSMALKEFGDQVDKLPRYTIRSDRSGQTGFKATLIFHGIQATGSGKTKKLAQHEAAKKACAMLRINP